MKGAEKMKCERCRKVLTASKFLYYKPTEQALCRGCFDTVKYQDETENGISDNWTGKGVEK